MRSHRKIINETATALAQLAGWTFPPGTDLVAIRDEDTSGHDMSQHKRHVRVSRHVAEAEMAFEVITGDRPDYASDEEEEPATASAGEGAR